MTESDLSPFAGIAAAAQAGVLFDESSVQITDPDMPYEVYEELLVSAGRVKRSMSWWIGDLINFGEGMYPDRYSQAMEATGLRYETISNYAWVCRRVARSRRRDRLAFGIHAEVAPLPPREQTHWLSEAAKNGWTTSELREAIRWARMGVEQQAPAIEASSNGLAPVVIAEAAGSLATVRETLDALAEGDTVPVGSIAKTIQAVERASETLRIAATIPTLRSLVESMLAEATPYDPQDGGETYYLVPTATIDELRALVGEEIRV